MSQSREAEPTIRIRTYRLARDVLGGKELTWPITDGMTVRALLDEISVEYDVDAHAFLVMINGRNIKLLDGLETSLSDGDDVSVSIGSLPED